MAGEFLIACSFVWLIIWSIMGLIAGTQHSEWLQRMKTVSQEGDLSQFWSTYDGLKVQTLPHAHANAFACVVFLIGLAMTTGIIGYSTQLQLGLAIWIVVAVVVSGIGDRLRFVPMAAAGAILFLIALIASFIGMFV